ncbi:MAG: hydroxyacid dehydrogenase [Deltaproteobacteria bacterium]|nr:MAG: hydroxyacid dehydrogenase [Deltaproteobacteria bacterium]
MIKVKSTSLDFGKMDRDPIDLLIANGCEFESVQIDANSEEQGIEVVRDADVLVVGLQRMTEKVLDAAKRLKVIGRCGVGLDNIDLKAAGARGIPVVYTPGANAQTVADLTLGLLLALARKIPQADRMTKGGQWKRIMGNDVWGKTLGICGLGQIGFNVAKRAKGFDMNVIAYDLFENLPLAGELGIQYKSKAEILGESDYITLHLPLTRETRGFIGIDDLKAMKKTAILVNTSRGGIVDENALYLALKEGEIAGAALDVFEHEPPGKTPLVELDNFIGCPHIGGITTEAIGRIGMTVARDIVSVLKGQTPKFLANKEWMVS